MTLRPVDSIAARVTLHQSARSRGYKLSRERTDPRSLRGGVCGVCVCVRGLSKVCVCRLFLHTP
jgi:hypothetical protein